jgi:Protein of unknown function (DUF3592)
VTDAVAVGGLFVGVGAALLAGVAWLLALAHASDGWPSVSGRVTESKCTGAWGTSSSGSRLFSLRLSYEYEVDGRRFEGHRVAFGDMLWSATKSKQSVDALCKLYHPGRTVTVFHDPRQPGRCTLTRGVGQLPFYQTLGVGVLILLGGVGAMLGWIQVR